MNVYDTARMADVLAPLGFVQIDTPHGADMVILNTCHIREKASEKVFSELGRLRKIKSRKEQEGGRMLIAVAGCVAQAEGEEFLRRTPQVDLIVGPQTYHRLPELVEQFSSSASMHRVLSTDFPPESKFDYLPEERENTGPAAFLTVQEGCDKFCAFCVVPYTRGAECSRPVADIIAEAKRLVRARAKEVTLLGQNVNAYHGQAPEGSIWGLGRLIGELAKIEGLHRIRYTTSHPGDMNDELIDAHREQPKLMPFLHLPVQSGSDRILGMMNRRHSADDYRRLVDRLRRARPDLSLSSDFIVGFPGESDRDFAETLRLVTDVSYSQAYSFKYSPRPGTPGAMLNPQVPESVKDERLATLQLLIHEQQLSFNLGTVGRVLPVLLERLGRYPGQVVGRTPYMQAVHLGAPASLLGRIATVRIIGAHANSLAGRLEMEDATDEAGPSLRECGPAEARDIL